MYLSRWLLLLLGIGMGSTTVAQHDYSDYQDYGDYGGGGPDGGPDYNDQDSLYHDYAQRQEEKAVGSPSGGGGGLGRAVALGALSWIVGGKIHAMRATKKLRTQFQKEQKALYTQYYNDVYKLTEQNTHLTYMVEQLEKTLKESKEKAELEAIQRDYDEFKQPDIDGDDRISRAEFNMYVKNYLANYPGLQEKDYPKFEDFDHDNDGYVSFKEYAQQMALQVQQAELEQLNAAKKGQSAAKTKKQKAIEALYQDSKKGRTFEDLYYR